MLKLNHLDYYRLPWNLTDNSISWLEPTAKCNLSCDGCYRKNENSHKSMEVINEELDVFTRLRQCDGVSIAGGDPLTHPDIVEIVKSVKKRNLKPIINTNGLALTKELLHELKKAGVFGFTFHIDSKQGRPGWRNKNELEMNELRLHYAKMLAEEGGISCSFNSTVYEDTMQFIPGMVKWSQEHIDIVQVMVFILYRAVNNEKVDFYLGPKKIDMNQLVYNEETTERTDIIAEEIVELLRKDDPNFDPCAYLNGSEKPDSFKWLLTGRLGRKNKIYGYVGSKGMEIMQTFYHLFNNKYLAYAKPKDAGKGRSMLLLTPFDKRLKKTLFNYVKNPLNIFRKLYYQSVMIIQPVDFLEDGRQNMCDGCPDITVWNGKLVWSCRMEEQLNFGHNLKTYPKDFMN
ncbi:MAG: radical SAM protein [Ignavibacteria bacterium GWA2_35_9]|nr:MAG: radical SAM protein [Ignavibacteria bacterium GWA2_35_9]OGU51956.1 MAG: radical SAM protein [Ignavibacteria bacterium GWC2_36_12]OGU99369.1 MAG: radical SAM protein [Ignavibacteria bacterium RIFOXYB2_FULL_36_7]